MNWLNNSVFPPASGAELPQSSFDVGGFAEAGDALFGSSAADLWLSNVSDFDPSNLASENFALTEDSLYVSDNNGIDRFVFSSNSEDGSAIATSFDSEGKFAFRLTHHGDGTKTLEHAAPDDVGGGDFEAELGPTFFTFDAENEPSGYEQTNDQGVVVTSGQVTRNEDTQETAVITREGTLNADGTEVVVWKTSVTIKKPATEAEPNPQPKELVDGDIGRVFGASLGRVLGGDNLFAQVATGSALATVLENVDEAIRLGAAGINGALSQAFSNFGDELFVNLRNAGVNVVSSLLAAELGEALNIGDGVGADLFQYAASSTIGSTLNVVLTNVVKGEADLLKGLGGSLFGTTVNGVEVPGTFSAGNIGSFFGSYLANEIVEPETQAGAIGGSIGGAIGRMLPIPIPGVGAFIGTIIGTLIGDFVSDVFGWDDGPDSFWGWQKVTYDYGQKRFERGDNRFEKDITTKDINNLKAMADAAIDVLNNYADVVGGTVTRVKTPKFYMAWTAKTQSFRIQASVDGKTYTNSTGDGLVEKAILRSLRTMRFEGGNPYLAKVLRTSRVTTLAKLNKQLKAIGFWGLQNVEFDAATGLFVPGALTHDSDILGDDKDVLRAMADTAVDVLNEYVELIGGTLDLSDTLSFYMAWKASDGQLRVEARTADGTFDLGNVEEAVREGVFRTLKDFRIDGGDPYIKRALENSEATTLDVLLGDLQIAADYSGYLKNKGVVDALITQDPNSSFSAAWIITLVRADELRLEDWNRSDFYGGVKAFFESFGLEGEGFSLRDVSISIEGTTLVFEQFVDGQSQGRIEIAEFADKVEYQHIVATLDGAQVNGTSGSDFWQAADVDSIFVDAATADRALSNDILLGGAGNDTITAGDGDDYVRGGAGNDVLDGGHGVDVLIGGSGDDRLEGGHGDDIYYVGAGADRIFDVLGQNRIVFGEGVVASDLSFSLDQIVSDGGAGFASNLRIAIAGSDDLVIENWSRDAFTLEQSDGTIIEVPKLAVGQVDEDAIAAAGTVLRTYNDPTPTSGDQFGHSVALDRGRVLVGARFDNTLGTDVGQAHLLDMYTGAVLQTFDNPSPGVADDFGHVVALEGNFALIGAQRDNTKGTEIGQAYLFDTVTGALVRTFNDPTKTTKDRFGSSVALSGDYALIGARLDDTQATNSGQAHVFDVNTGALVRTFNNPSPHEGDQFGVVVAIDGNLALVSAYLDDADGTDVGRVYLFDVTTGVRLRTFVDPTPTSSDRFGSGLAIKGNLIVIAAQLDDTNGTDVGQVHLFDATTGALLHTLDDPNPTSGDRFGGSVAIDGDIVAVGSNGDDTNGTDVGQVHLFSATTGVLLQTLDDPTPTSGDQFGRSVAMSDGFVVTGALNDDTAGTNVGQVHLFSTEALDFTTLDLPSLIDFGVDGPAAGGGFALSSDTGGLPVLTSNGEAIVYSIDGDTLAGYVDNGTTPGVLDDGDRRVLTLKVDPQGYTTFALHDNIDHAGGPELLPLDFSSAIEATDGDGDIITLDPGQLVFKVLNANVAPSATADAGFEAGEDQALTISAADLLGNDTDANGDPLTIASVQGAVNGTVELDAQGNVVFTGNAGYVGPASFTYTADDGRGGTSTVTVDLTVNESVPEVTSSALVRHVSEDDIVASGALLQTYDDPTPTTSDEFGYSVAIDGGRILAGSRMDDTVGTNAGQAHLLDMHTGAVLQTFDNPSPGDTDEFGYSVALDGNLALIGAQRDDTQAVDAGQAYLFDADTGALLRTFDSPSPATNDRFGISVALSGGLALIGARLDDTQGSNIGQAYLFDVNTGALLQTFDDPTPTGGDEFGYSVAMDGNRAVIGARLDNTQGTYVGQAHLFDVTTGALLHTFDDPTPTTEDYFGDFVAISGDYVAVGARMDDTQGTDVGQVHVFDANTGALLRTFDDPTPVSNNRSGYSIAIDGDVITVGTAQNEIHLFSISTGALLQTVEGSGSLSGSFGASVAMADGVVVASARKNDVAGTDIGQAYLFKASDGTSASLDLTRLVDFGVDGPAAGGGFALKSDTSGLPVLTSNGEAIVYDVDGDTLTGFVDSGTTPGVLDAGDRRIFSLQVTPAGNAIFTLLDNIDHAGGPELLPIDFSSVIEATDSDGDVIGLGTDRVVFTVQNENVAPVAAADSGFVTGEDQALTISAADLLGNDTDANGDPLTIGSVQDALGGTAALDGNGDVVFTPDADHSGAASFSYTADDGRGGTSTVTVDLNVNESVPELTAAAVDGQVSEDHVAAAGALLQTYDDPTPTSGDLFGTSVAVDSGRVLVGARDDDTVGADVGQAHLLDMHTGAMLQTFDNPSATSGDRFGDSVALHGDLALIGSPYDDANGNNVGRAYLFDTNTGALLQTFDDPSPTNQDLFGALVALSGDYALVSAYVHDTTLTNTGQAHLFDVNTGALLQTFDDPNPTVTDYFGYGLAIEGDLVAIGAYRDDTNGNNVGQVHLFDATTGALLRTLDDPTPTTDDQFGWAVAIQGDLVVVSAYTDDTNGTDVGQVHLFSASTGALLHTLDDPTPTSGDNFGYSVSVDGDIVAVGTNKDQLYLFDASTGALLQTLDDPTPTNDQFGRSVAISDGFVVVGARADDTQGANVGEAHLFKASDGASASLDLTGLVDFGVDGPASGGGFGLKNDTSGLPALASNGEAIVYSVDGDTLTGFVDSGTTPGVLDAGDRRIFSLQVTPAGNAIFTLLDNIDHAGGPELLPLDFSSVIEATDSDGDVIGLGADRVVFTVQNENVAPVAAADSGFVTGEDQALTISASDLLGNDTDANGDPLTIGSVQDAVGGTAALDGNGDVVFTPDADHSGPASFTYTADDGRGGTSTVTVDLTVNESVPEATTSALVAQVDEDDIAAAGTVLRTYDDPTPTSVDQFGHSVAVDSGRVLVGARYDDTTGIDVGQAHLLDMHTGAVLQTFNSPSAVPDDRFGESVALHGDLALIGAPYDDANGNNIGRAYLFDTNTGALLRAFDDPTPTTIDLFGTSVALSGDYALVSAYAHDTSLTNIGQAHLFDVNTGALLQTFDDPTPTITDYFGYAVAVDSNLVAIGAFRDDTSGTDVGQVHLFDAISSWSAPPRVHCCRPSMIPHRRRVTGSGSRSRFAVILSRSAPMAMIPMAAMWGRCICSAPRRVCCCIPWTTPPRRRAICSAVPWRSTAISSWSAPIKTTPTAAMWARCICSAPPRGPCCRPSMIPRRRTRIISEDQLPFPMASSWRE